MTTGTPGNCDFCNLRCESRNELIVHYADDHHCEKEDIAHRMGYAPQSVASKLYQARRLLRPRG